MLMALVEAANLAVRFLSELCVLAGQGYWEFRTGTGLFVKIVLGIGAPLAVALVWAAFGAPASEMELHGASPPQASRASPPSCLSEPFECKLSMS
jgi:hypothetical protein